MGEGSRFRGQQKAALEAVMRGEPRVLVVMGTGGGKSLVFMLPAWCGSGGTTVVVVPLIALREDLKSRCGALGISCQEWDSRRPADGSRIVLVTPESALSPSFASFINRLQGVHQLDRIVIDECHTVLNTQPGFRPKLQNLGQLNRAEVPLIMLTATLPPSQEEELYRRMWLRKDEVKVFRDSTVRSNIAYTVRQLTEKDAAEGQGELFELIERMKIPYEGKIIVYCNSVRKTISLAEELECDGYHHDAEGQKDILARVIKGTARVLVATSAFGMGIDVPDIRLIIHADRPRTLLDYSQESGRAGRDGFPREAIILLGPDEKGAEVPGQNGGGDRSMQDFLSASCKRVVLDSYLDGRLDRTGCEDDEEKCQGCRGPAREKDVEEEIAARSGEEHPSAVLDSQLTLDPRRALDRKTTDKKTAKMQGLVERKNQEEQQAGLELEELKRHLERIQGTCSYCTLRGLTNNRHLLY